MGVKKESLTRRRLVILKRVSEWTWRRELWCLGPPMDDKLPLGV